MIVVDDLHLAAPDPALLTAFTEALPDRFRFAVGTRADPPMSLARLRLRGELLEVRADDLSFAPDELSEFLALYDIGLTGDELPRLHDLTEGWPAGAQLAAIALQRGIDHEEFLQAFAGTDRAVSDFLVSEMLAGLPPALVQFLVETSVLDAFDAELCAAVTGIEGSGAVLDHLVTANVFVVPLDQQGRWYRYHHQFRAFLRARPGIVRPRPVSGPRTSGHVERSRIAGMTSARCGRPWRCPTRTAAGRIVRAALGRSTSRPDGTDLTVRAIRLWLHEFGTAKVETDPAWVMELLIELMTLNDSDDGPAWLERVRQTHPRADGELTALIEMALAEHHQQRGQPLQAIARLRAAAEAIGDIAARPRPTRAPRRFERQRTPPGRTGRPSARRHRASPRRPTRQSGRRPGSCPGHRRPRRRLRRRAHPRRAAHPDGAKRRGRPRPGRPRTRPHVRPPRTASRSISSATTTTPPRGSSTTSRRQATPVIARCCTA